MLKKLFLFIALASSFQLLAMEQEFSIHAPKFKDEISKFLKTHVERENRTIGGDILEGTFTGAISPWVASAAVGAFGLEALHRANHGTGDSLPIAAFGGAIGIGVFSPVSLLLSLPFGVVGSMGGVCNNIFKGIAAHVNEKEFDQHIALHMYQWISVVKAGRLAIRADLKAWQKDHEECANSVCATASAMLKDEKFKQYFGETGFHNTDLTKILAQIDPKKDNWNNMFQELSKLVKISEFSENEWLALEHALVNYKNTTEEFPKLSVDDIHEYLYVSVYYFTLANQGKKTGVDWLKSFIY